ncbi:hypothetical protein [Haloferula rosea]|uniref:PEP-CTERM sorting domain-containing protein n=1 Tax=Haloferula rosea TaxID=490093 RepID=A0A934RFE4_9BACT|nr:hypothetical protein [Haloferula rosea]MBK1827541.1 hypothetical protein [Haloferula rosea]
MSRSVWAITIAATCVSHAAIIVGDAAILAPDDNNPYPQYLSPPENFESIFLQSQPGARTFILTTTGGNLAYDVRLDFLSNSATFSGLAIAEPYSLMRVPQGTLLDAAFFLGNRNSGIDLEAAPLNLSDVTSSRIFLGFAADRDNSYFLNPGTPLFDDGDKFGWAELALIGSELVVINSATSTDGPIIVGIPEPACSLLAVSGLAMITALRKRH